MVYRYQDLSIEQQAIFEVWSISRSTTDLRWLMPRNEIGQIPTRDVWKLMKAEIDARYARIEETLGVDGWNLDALGRLTDREDSYRRQIEDYHQRKLARKDHGGYVYLLRVEGRPHFKIGKTRNPKQRYKMLSIQLPFAFEVVHTIKSTNMGKTEADLHDRFKEKRLNGEWFALDQGDIDWICNIDEVHEDAA